MCSFNDHQLQQLANNIKLWGKDLGFQAIGISDINLEAHQAHLKNWLDANYHGSMAWMAQHGDMRTHPEQLLLGTVRVISARMNYLPLNASFAKTLASPNHAYISRYALGRDYHKMLRNRLKKLGERIKQECESLNFRPFVDSAPILERPLAQKAGLGWAGKHSLLLNQEAGSWFFIGEILVNIPLPVDIESVNQCGRCIACKTSCPTGAIVADYIVDARRCLSYLTIEFDGVIPIEFRKAMGNRIYGCDDCQLACPYNKESELTEEQDFYPRASLWQQPLTALFQWTEAQFLKNTEGSPIRRIGFVKWQRNIIIAMGNAPFDQGILALLENAKGNSALLDEHIAWAITEQLARKNQNVIDVLPNKTKRLIRSIEKGMPRDA